MYDGIIFWDLRLYDIFFFLGLVAALVVFSKYTGKKGMPAGIQNFYLNLAIASIAGGYLSAFLFQAVYNFFETGVFVFKGITFLGGLIGGGAVFLAGYKLFAKEDAKKYFNMVIEVAPCGVLIAHALGRVGCFFAGCCYGLETDSLFGMRFPGHAHNVFPTQLYEAIFLFIMFAVTSYLYFKDKKINMIVYLTGYGLFRFLIEFIRGDYRGEFIISFLSPSQTLSLFMVIAGIYMLYKKYNKQNKDKDKDKKTD